MARSTRSNKKRGTRSRTRRQRGSGVGKLLTGLAGLAAFSPVNARTSGYSRALREKLRQQYARPYTRDSAKYNIRAHPYYTKYNRGEINSTLAPFPQYLNPNNRALPGLGAQPSYLPPPISYNYSGVTKYDPRFDPTVNNFNSDE